MQFLLFLLAISCSSFIGANLMCNVNRISAKNHEHSYFNYIFFKNGVKQ